MIIIIIIIIIKEIFFCILVITMKSQKLVTHGSLGHYLFTVL